MKAKDSISYYKPKDNMLTFYLTLTQYPNGKTIFNITKKNNVWSFYGAFVCNDSLITSTNQQEG